MPTTFSCPCALEDSAECDDDWTQHSGSEAEWDTQGEGSEAEHDSQGEDSEHDPDGGGFICADGEEVDNTDEEIDYSSSSITA